MNLFEKINWFYKKAQELKTDPGGMSAGTEGKAVPATGYPHQSIRATAKDTLNKLMANKSVPNNLKTKPNSLGDLLGDFLGGRFADKDLDYHWDSYLAAIMDKINKTKLETPNRDLSVFYQSLFNTFSKNWDAIAAAGWTSKVAKPESVVWLATDEDPWGENKSPLGADPFADPNQWNPEKEKMREQQSTQPIDLKTSRKDLFKKLSKLK